MFTGKYLKPVVSIQAVLFGLIILTSCANNDVNTDDKTEQVILRKVGDAETNWIPTEGYISNKDMAIKIGVIILQSSYGAKKIQQQEPFNAILDGNTWIVTGGLRKGKLGGVAEIHLDKLSGRVLMMSHGK